MTATSKPSRILVLGALCALFAAPALAQQTYQPLSPNLSPALTNDPLTHPLTTLSIDLLAPQHTYIYDQTGASLAAGSMNPNLLSTVTSGLTSQTDTAIRDSSQTGHPNPFGSGGSRLSELLSANGSGSSSVTALQSGTQNFGGEGMAQSRSADPYLPSGDEPNSAYSSWDGSSPESGASSWGTKAISPARMQVSRIQGARIQVGSIQANRIESPSQLPGSQQSSAFSGPEVSANNRRPGSQLWANPSRNTASNANSSLVRAPATPPSSGSGAAAATRSSAGAADVADPLSPGSQIRSGTVGAQAAARADGQTPHTLERVLMFSPQSYAAYTFGRSPFSSPGDGDRELTFLNPNIFDISAIDLTNRSQRSANDQSPRFLHPYEDNGALPTRSSGYGIASRLGSGTSRLHQARDRQSRTNPYSTSDGLHTNGIYAAGVNR